MFFVLLQSYRFYPSNFEVLNWLGNHYLTLGVPEKALPFFKKATTISPNEPKWHLLVASCYKKTGNHQKAVEVYKKLHKENPDNIECKSNLIERIEKNFIDFILISPDYTRQVYNYWYASQMNLD